jgi:hypothetical protein
MRRNPLKLMWFCIVGVLMTIGIPAFGQVPKDGEWVVSGVASPTQTGCGPWAVRLKVAGGQLNASVVGMNGITPLPPMTMQADGSFTGSGAPNPASWNSRSAIPVFTVTGKFTGDTVTATLALSTLGCVRSGTAHRA